jgi:hypothetical protein
VTRSMKTTGDMHIDDGKFGIPRRVPPSRPDLQPLLGPNDISLLSKSFYGRNLRRDKTVV